MPHDEKKILIVDDEVTVTETLKVLLKNTDRYHVHAEHDSTKAVQTARDYRPDLILLDLGMPNLPGTEVVKQLRQDESLRWLPVVYLTESPGRTEAADRGPIEGIPVLTKPFLVEEIMMCLAGHLSGDAHGRMVADSRSVRQNTQAENERIAAALLVVNREVEETEQFLTMMRRALAGEQNPKGGFGSA
ncbi:MAG: two-component system, OmpR family, response regulator [Chthoniobacter sp.]|jgi:two-component system OmpR family response regulator|nr:two-component system, OmpR family, response regulator [Chthoniobacter sp.]